MISHGSRTALLHGGSVDTSLGSMAASMYFQTRERLQSLALCLCCFLCVFLLVNVCFMQIFFFC